MGEKEVKVFTYPNAIIKVHIPELTKEEREKRMKNISEASARLLKGVQI